MSCSTPKVFCHKMSFQSFVFLIIPGELLQTLPLKVPHYFLLSSETHSPYWTSSSSVEKSKSLLLCSLPAHLPALFPTSALGWNCIFTNTLENLVSFFFLFLWFPIYLYPLGDSCKYVSLLLPSSSQFLIKKYEYENILIH